jgi:hypothetical protein
MRLAVGANVAVDEGGGMTLEGVGVTQPNRITYHIRFKFGKQAYCVVEMKRGEEAAEIAKKLRELAAQVEARSK